MFGAVQKAHLTDSRNVGDAKVLVSIAAETGFEAARFSATDV
nr:hypothetical protein [Tianweitania sediminis]